MIKRTAVIATGMICSLGFGDSPAAAQAAIVDRKPKMAFSVSDNSSFETASGGPLFLRVKAAISAAQTGTGSSFSRFLVKGAELKLNSFEGTTLKKAPFNVQVIRAASKSCLGPYPFEEGKNWVQMSWVCRVSADTPLSKLLVFRESPELSLTVFFEGNLIKGSDATEPLQFPGARRFRMDAADVLRARQ